MKLSYVFDFKVLVSVDSERIEELEAVAERANISARAEFGQLETTVLWHDIRPATQSEILACVPRRFHKRGSDDRQICTTMYVKESKLVDEDDRVTCKLCLKEMERRKP